MKYTTIIIMFCFSFEMKKKEEKNEGYKTGQK